jgi:Cu(I)/Ag(I) efflux system membrane fusion protein
MRRTLPWILTVLLSAAAGATAVLVFDGRAPVEIENETGYVCPMHADILSEEPARCSICGMDLVPAGCKVDRADGDVATVTIAPNVVNSLGVRTLAVERRRLPRRVETVGYVEYDRTRLRHLFPPADGQIEELSISSEGERVEKGQFLFQLFSPMLGSSADKTYAQQDGVVVELNIIEGSYVNSTTRVMTLADLDTVWVVADVF